MSETQYITSSEALNIVHSIGIKIVLLTLLRWVEKNNQIGIQPAGHDGRWFINKEQFLKHLHVRKHELNKKCYMSITDTLKYNQTLGIKGNRLTIIRWIRRYNELYPQSAPLGVQFQSSNSGEWWVNKKVYERFIHAKNHHN